MKSKFGMIKLTTKAAMEGNQGGEESENIENFLALFGCLLLIYYG
jgi:hypothetical protein